MRIFLRAILLASALSAVGVGTSAFAAPSVAPVLSTPDAKDVRSYARPLIARVTHVDLDLAADFATKTVSCQAAKDVLAAPGAQDIVIDTLGFLACFTVLMVICVAMLHSCAVEQANQEIQAEAWEKQLEKGEVVEMTVRVGGAE